MGEGRELFYTDENGDRQDESLWDEILGADDQHTVDINSLPDPEDKGESEPVSFTR